MNTDAQGMTRPMGTAAGQCLAALLGMLALAACAPMQLAAVPDRLTAEQLAALAPASPEKAAEATRLTEQADREARAAREREAARQRELSRIREFRRLQPYPSLYGPPYGPYPGWSAGIGYGRWPHVRPGWGAWYGF